MSPGPGTGHLCVCLCDGRWRGESMPARKQQSADRGNESWVWVSLKMILFSGTYCRRLATHCDFNNIISSQQATLHDVMFAVCRVHAQMQTELQPTMYVNRHQCTRIKRHQRHRLVSWRRSQQRSHHETVTPKFWHCQNFIAVYLRSNDCDSHVCTCLTLRTSG